MLSILLFLSDSRSENAASVYDHAQQTFVRGYLKEAQREAHDGYRRFFWSVPEWSRKFQLLEARAMQWRGLNEGSLPLLAQSEIPWETPDDIVQRSAMQADALTSLHRLKEADGVLRRARGLCLPERSIHCYLLLRAEGKFLLQRGEVAQATQEIVSSLEVARRRNDALMEGSLLLTLGTMASHRESHDEALSLYRLAYQKSMVMGAMDLAQRALGNEGWEQYSLGNLEKALDLSRQAEAHAITLGDTGDEINWLTIEALAYASMGEPELAEKSDLNAIKLAKKIGKQQPIIDASMDLAKLYVESNKPDAAERFATQALTLVREGGSKLDTLNAQLYLGEAAALRHDGPRAEPLLRGVSGAEESQQSMKWEAERALASVYQEGGNARKAEECYTAALALIEGARSDLKQEVSQLTFLANAARLYDDYVHFLIAQGRTLEALQAADWSRARTLQQGLGLTSSTVIARPPAFNPIEIARRSNATLFFYWLGVKQSYLWVANGEQLSLFSLPPRSELDPIIARYRGALLTLKDPLRSSYKDGEALYRMLVSPAASLITPDRPVVIFSDGETSELNFETIMVGDHDPHYWIEDVNLVSAPSIRMFASHRPQTRTDGRLLLIGDPVSTGTGYEDLPMAAMEVERVRNHLSSPGNAVFTRERATPQAYLASHPELFSYIHFATHGIADRMDPLDSAVILSSGKKGSDSFKLDAAEIMKHPINARLVTISACNSSGSRSVAGEGMVGLSWAFIRAGAHNTIGALWEVSDASTPQLMDELYSGLERGQTPGQALRSAKLSLLHSNSKFNKPFYWAPFQLYTGR